MMNVTRYLAAAAAVGSLAAPAAAQYYPQPTYPQQYQQQYPQYQQQYPQQAYPGTAYGQQGYNQGYSQNPVQSIIDSLLGNRYNVTDRQAVSRCASAAVNQAQAQYAGGNGYNNNAYRQNYAGAMRVTAITDVQRRNNGLRVTGTMSSGGGYGGQQYGYQNRGYAGANLSFRCNVAYNGAVTGIRLGRIG